MRETISALLLAWYDQNARTLPWRGIHDPYRTWVSETMLQQTRVETVRGYYERFLARFPDVAALAAADEAESVFLTAEIQLAMSAVHCRVGSSEMRDRP